MTYEAIVTKEISDEPVVLSLKTEVYRFISEKYKIRAQGQTILLTLNASLQLINSYIIHIGPTDEDYLDIKDICLKAITDKAHKVVLCRVRPSASVSYVPNGSDYSIAEKIFRAMKIFNIEVRHQLIIGNGGYSEIKNDENGDEGMKQ
jgi:DNA repair protein RadC